MLDSQIEGILGDSDTLTHLLDLSLSDAGREASPSARELTRRLNDIEKRRTRVQDGYEAGVYDLFDDQNRSVSLDAERAEIEALMGRQDDEISISEDLVSLTWSRSSPPGAIWGAQRSVLC